MADPALEINHDIYNQHRPPPISSTAFLGAMWAFTAVATICLAIRLYARISRLRRLYWDDACVVAAYMLMLGSAIMWQCNQMAVLYGMMDFSAGLRPAPPLAEEMDDVFISQLVFAIFFYVILLLVKINFLLFFRRLAMHGGRDIRSKRQIIYWWVVLALCFVTVAVQVGTIQYKCFVNGFLYVYLNCDSNPDNIRGTWISVSIGFFFDVLTEVLIIAIPVKMVWNLKLPKRKKAALIALFSLAIITIAFSITRLTTLSAGRWGNTEKADPVNLWFWSMMQAVIALIVACLASFRVLYTSSQTKNKPAGLAGSGSSKQRSLLSKIFFFIGSKDRTLEGSDTSPGKRHSAGSWFGAGRWARWSGTNRSGRSRDSKTASDVPARPDLDPEVQRNPFVPGSPSPATSCSKATPSELEKGEGTGPGGNGIVREIGYQVESEQRRE